MFRRKLKPTRLPHPIIDAFDEGMWHFAVPIAFIFGVAVGVVLMGVFRVR